ncbi:MAG TPA: helix-turn-helix domain-containing protein [Dehalococcoidia bacterium]|nr:helix-turn-helix domain-containing protein [Dehalococcoidia bacterium]
MKIPNEERSTLMTTAEVALYLRISEASVYRLVRMKDIPASRVGRQLRFRRDMIDEWLSGEKVHNYRP